MLKKESVPEELMNARLTEGASEQSELHLAWVDGGHGRVTKASDPQSGLQLHLSARLRPQPADRETQTISHSHKRSFV